MSETWIGFLIFLPVFLAVVVGITMWRRLKNPVLFLVTAALALTGLQGLVAPAAVAVFFPNGGGITREVANSAFGHSIIASALVVMFVGLPFLWWLQRALRKEK